MSREQAKSFYAPASGEGDLRYISPQDAQGAIDVIYDDMAAQASQAVTEAVLGSYPRQVLP